MRLPPRVSEPLDEKVEVAVAPKYAWYADSMVEEERANCWSALKVLVVVVENAVVKAPVAELYASGYEALSDVDEILLANVVKSAEERYPLVPVVA